MIGDLLELRNALEKKNSEILELFLNRRDLIKKIIGYKDRANLFDPAREFLLFNRMKTKIQQLEMEELLSFSYIMEAQISKWGVYPHWSKRVHLQEILGEIWEEINPILLYIHSPNLYQRLALKNDIKNDLTPYF